MMNIIQAIRCHRTAKWLSRYVDMDPSAQLSDKEIQQVRAHLTECEKCTSSVKDLSKIKSSLHWIGASQVSDEPSITRIKATLDELTAPKE